MLWTRISCLTILLNFFRPAYLLWQRTTLLIKVCPFKFENRLPASRLLYSLPWCETFSHFVFGNRPFKFLGQRRLPMKFHRIQTVFILWTSKISQPRAARNHLLQLGRPAFFDLRISSQVSGRFSAKRSLRITSACQNCGLTNFVINSWISNDLL